MHMHDIVQILFVLSAEHAQHIHPLARLNT